MQAFEELLAALLVASVLLTLDLGVFVLEVCELVVKRLHVSLLGPHLHHLVPQLVQERILMSLRHSHRLRCLAIEQLLICCEDGWTDLPL